MKFRVTSVGCQETVPPLLETVSKVAGWLNAALGDGDFGEGVDKFIIVAVSVDDEIEKNIRWSNGHNSTGRFKDRTNGEFVRFISSAVLLPPSSVISKTPTALLSYFCTETIDRLSVRPKRIPKGFDYVRCASAVAKTLEIFVNEVH